MSPISITICFMIFAAVMFIWEKIPLAVTSMTVCLGLVVTGVLDSKTAFAGFINTNVILFVAMFIVGGALFETGMANKIGGIVTKFAKTEKQLIIAIMIIVGVLSGILSNTGTAAILIPVVVGIADKSGFARSKLLMPLVLAAAMGGNLTLIGAPGNLIAQSALEDLSLKFSFFDFAKIGLPMLACGVLYFSVFGHKLLPDIKNIEESCEKEDESKFVYLRCELEDRMIKVVIEDRGKGIEDIKQAMQPMYTSKPELDRAGMGFSFMESFMDTLEVVSIKGEGTKVVMTKTIELPK